MVYSSDISRRSSLKVIERWLLNFTTEIFLLLSQDRIMYLSDEFDGKQSNSSDFVALGFLNYQICPHPNFIADGERVQPSPSGESMAGIDMFQAPVNTARGVENYLFVYNFYAIPQIRQIANAKSVKYKICNNVYSLSTADRAELRQFLSRFK